MNVRILQRYKKSNEWPAEVILAAGEMGVESDTGFTKIGDGIKSWSELEYSTGANNPESTEQLYFFQFLPNAPMSTTVPGHRGQFAFVYTGPEGKRIDRPCMFLNVTPLDENDEPKEETSCKLVPISFFAGARERLKDKNNESISGEKK